MVKTVVMTPFMTTSERLSLFSDLERFSFYGLPDFDDEQRVTFLTFETKELELILECPSLHTQVYCAVQIGYFKAKQTFFRFSLNKIPREDLQFILSRYVNDQTISTSTVTKYEYYLQREAICRLFGYQNWSNDLLPQLLDRCKLSVKRDITPNFIAHELLNFLQTQKIVRPGYTTLQTVVSQALTVERTRIKVCLQTHLSEFHKESLAQLIKKESTLSELAALRQDAKSFSSSMMRLELRKHTVLKPLYDISMMIFAHLDISQQNIAHYASLAHNYTISDLSRFGDEQTYLYLLCYVYKRYQQINDNLVDAFHFNIKKLETSIKKKLGSEEKETPDNQIGRLLLMYVDDKISDLATFGDMREQAFKILPKNSIRSIGEKMLKQPKHRQDLQWKERDKLAKCYKHHLRPLFMKIDFKSNIPESNLLKSIYWMKSVFTKQQSLAQQPSHSFPAGFISPRIAHYVRITDKNDRPIFISNRYEIMVYKQILKQMKTGAIHIEDTIKHRSFADELVCTHSKEAILEKLDIPWLKSPCDEQLDSLFKELDVLWDEFDQRFKHGTIKHLKHDFIKKEVKWLKDRSVHISESSKSQTLYDKIPIADIADVVRFVNNKTSFLSIFTPLQQRYNKNALDEDHLVAVLIAQATGIGNHKMAQTSDISYGVLESTYQQYLHLATIKRSHDAITHAMMSLSIFPYYTFDQDILYGGVDGQKYEAITPTAKARYSRKYYKKGRGVVAYTLLTNHVPIQTDIIGADHESYFVFDIWYNNTSLLNPTVITGDMHSINKVNFALLHWFGEEFRPRFTNIKKELKNVCCTKNPSAYHKFLVQPTVQINRQLIVDEKENINRVIATLALKEISQNTLVRKLCALSSNNNVRKAIFEFDKLIRSIYTLKCILDPQLLHFSNVSQNRIESYHSLRGAIAKIGGRKALLGRTDLDIEISNQCGRILASVIIYYNASIHSCLWEHGNKKQLKELKKSSPVAWQHIHFTGHFAFYTNKNHIDIDKIVAKIEL